jgi:hypothetical protein
MDETKNHIIVIRSRIYTKEARLITHALTGMSGQPSFRLDCDVSPGSRRSFAPLSFMRHALEYSDRAAMPACRFADPSIQPQSVVPTVG